MKRKIKEYAPSTNTVTAVWSRIVPPEGFFGTAAFAEDDIFSFSAKSGAVDAATVATALARLQPLLPCTRVFPSGPGAVPGCRGGPTGGTGLLRE
ncbi:hypothetical protein TNCV_2654041 [Trichonephila clavipes]|nr:hypothetical protein TNCV_2654041 [Trichonephila clavipes]